MYKLKILSNRKIYQYNSPPNFSYKEQCYFFNFPNSIEFKSKSLTLENRIGLILSFGYFRASGKFYTPSKFRKNDIHFICQKLNYIPFEIDFSNYSRSVHHRQKKIIVDYLGYFLYNKKEHDILLKRHIKNLVSSQIQPVNIFNNLIEYLKSKKIELPTYNHVHTLITNELKEFQNVLEKFIKNKITHNQSITNIQLS